MHIFKSKMKKLPTVGGGHPPPLPHPPPARSLRSLAEIVPPKCFGSLRQCSRPMWGLEPTTLGLRVPCSTDWAYRDSLHSIVGLACYQNTVQEYIYTHLYIIQILTGTVMKHHVSVDCQESYIFPRGYIFPKRAVLRENIITRENITILAPPTRDISSVPVNICYIRWSKWMISSKFDGALWLSRILVTRLGVCVQTIWTQTWQFCALSIMTFYC